MGPPKSKKIPTVIMNMPCVWVTVEGIGLDPLKLALQMYVRWPSMAQVLGTELVSAGRTASALNY